MTWTEAFEKVDYYNPVTQVLCFHEGLLRLKKYNKLLEVGCGSGFISSILAKDKLVVSIDVDREVCKRVKQKYNGIVVCADMKHLPFRTNIFDCAFSQGVLEHCRTDYAIHDSLDEQLRVSKVVLFEVPTRNWLKAKSSKWTFGDERWLTNKYWRGLVSERYRIVQRYGWGFLPKFRRLSSYLPAFIWNRVKWRFANTVGFMIIPYIPELWVEEVDAFLGDNPLLYILAIPTLFVIILLREEKL